MLWRWKILLHTSTSSGWCSPRAVFVIDISEGVHDLVVVIEEACDACDTLFSSRLPFKKDREVGRCVTCKSATALVLECDALGWIPEVVANVDPVPQGPCKSVQDVHPTRRAQHTLSQCRGWTWHFASVFQKLIRSSVPSRRLVTAATLSSQVAFYPRKGFHRREDGVGRCVTLVEGPSESRTETADVGW